MYIHLISLCLKVQVQRGRDSISSQYLATVETCRKFPTPEVLDRLVGALGIDTHELFSFASTPQNELEKLRKDIIGEVVQTIKQSLAEGNKNNK